MSADRYRKPGKRLYDCPSATTLYRLLRKRGQGGMGIVYEALQLSLRRKVAVKVLSPSLVAKASMREQFARESQVIAMLHHPNIVQVFGAGSVGETYYYAMEWIDGQGLDRSAPRGSRDIAGDGYSLS